MTKRVHLGRAAQLGLESALLAQRGFTGPTTVLEGRYGYFAAFSPRPAIDELLSGLGRRWLAGELVIKAYPCHATSQAIVHAIQRFKRHGRLDVSAISRVSITAGPRIVEERHLDQEPGTILGAQYSLPYTVAVALARDMSNPLVFSADVLEDPVIRGLATKIHARADAHRFGESDGGPVAEVTLEFAETETSETLVARDFPGSLALPLDFEGATEKFFRCARPVIGERHAGTIVEVVRDLDRLPDTAQLAALIRGEHAR